MTAMPMNTALRTADAPSAVRRSGAAGAPAPSRVHGDARVAG